MIELPRTMPSNHSQRVGRKRTSKSKASPVNLDTDFPRETFTSNSKFWHKETTCSPEDFIARQHVCAFIETALPGAL
jgi:hypothetical protein